MIVADMPFDEYKVAEGINASAIKAGRTSMLHMHHYINKPESETTPAMEWGSLAHLAVLEPDRLSDEVVTWDASKRTKAYKEFKAENEGKYILSREELSDLEAMIEAVHAHPEAGTILHDTQKEVSLFWENNCGKCKARIDALDSSLICDLKTTSAIHPAKFQSQAWSLGYFEQMGWYAAGFESEFGHMPDAYIIALESKAPFDVVVFELSGSALKYGRQEAEKVAKLYQITEKTGCAFEGCCDQIQTLNVPEWVETDASTGKATKGMKL
jgi:hypothetical protein